jgi:hypothetical protein
MTMAPESLPAGRLADRVSYFQESERDRGKTVADRFLLPRRTAGFMSCLHREVPVVTHARSSRRRTATYNTGVLTSRAEAAGDGHTMTRGKQISRCTLPANA